MRTADGCTRILQGFPETLASGRLVLRQPLLSLVRQLAVGFTRFVSGIRERLEFARDVSSRVGQVLDLPVVPHVQVFHPSGDELVSGHLQGIAEFTVEAEAAETQTCLSHCLVEIFDVPRDGLAELRCQQPVVARIQCLREFVEVIHAVCEVVELSAASQDGLRLSEFLLSICPGSAQSRGQMRRALPQLVQRLHPTTAAADLAQREVSAGQQLRDPTALFASSCNSSTLGANLMHRLADVLRYPVHVPDQIRISDEQFGLQFIHATHAC